MSNQFDFKKFLKTLPNDPGVYRMLDSNHEILYVGKANNLKKRVSSYFISKTISPKTRSLLDRIKTIEITVTSSETEALLLESSLIKTLKPPYNVLLRDDKSYPYLYISTNHKFARLDIMRFKRKPKKGYLFGPYPSASKVREALNIIQKVFKLRNCTDAYFATRVRPCLQYQIERCSAPCTGFITKEEYQAKVLDAINFLKGKSQQILKKLIKEMDEASKNLEYEKAAKLRDAVQSLRIVQEQQAIYSANGDADVVVINVRERFALVEWVGIRNGQVISNQQIFPKMPQYTFDLDHNELWQEVFKAFLAHFYFDTPQRIPSMIITDNKVEEVKLWEETLSKLRKKKCRIICRPVGTKRMWVDFAHKNLNTALAKHNLQKAKMSDQMEALRQFLQIPQKIKRIECFDISHTQGNNTVASCVVFNENGPVKEEYRRYNIKTSDYGDDYKAMEEVLTRRFQRIAEKTHLLPDVVIVDGGKGQVSTAKKVLKNLNITNVCLLGIAKGITRKAGWEKIIMGNDNSEVTLPDDSLALHLLQMIRDEAHRFAITFHRKKRAKSSLKFSIEGIEGIGTKRRQALLKRFGGLRELANASIDEIAKVDGISKDLARKIYEHFH